MKLTANEIRAAFFAVSTCRRALAGRTVPPSVAALADRLDTVIRTGEVARTRQETVALQQESNVELIGTALAARILGWSTRSVQRYAADLDGRLIGGRLVFPARSVEEYRDAQQEDE